MPLFEPLLCVGVKFYFYEKEFAAIWQIYSRYPLQSFCFGTIVILSLSKDLFHALRQAQRDTTSKRQAKQKVFPAYRRQALLSGLNNLSLYKAPTLRPLYSTYFCKPPRFIKFSQRTRKIVHQLYQSSIKLSSKD